MAASTPKARFDERFADGLEAAAHGAVDQEVTGF